MITSVKIKDNTKTPFEYVSNIEAFENGREFIFKPGVNVIIGKNGNGRKMENDCGYIQQAEHYM